MAFGVDLGTTNSSIAWADPTGDVFSLKVRRDPKEPFDAVERSLVLDPLGQSPVVGHLAEGAVAPGSAALLVSSFKRRFDMPRLRQHGYEVVAGTTGDYDPVNECIVFTETLRRVPVYYDAYSLAEVVASAGLVLGRLLGSTEVDLDGAASRAATTPSVVSRLLRRREGAADEPAQADRTVEAQPDERLFIGVPVSFGPTAKRRLLRALVASGEFGEGSEAYRRVLDRCRVVYEPLALASTLQLFDPDPQNVLIVDYGGGTLDLALLRVDAAGGMRELALGGLATAGDRLDELFREYLLETRPGLRRMYEEQFELGGQDRYAAVTAFTRAKVELSTRSNTIIRLFDDLDVTRGELDRAISPELDRAMTAVRHTLDRAGMNAKAVGTLLLTGGSSLVPAVQERLREAFPHLDDDLSFDAGIPGDLESERRALTGVSRGLALHGFRQELETSAPGAFSVFVPSHGAQRVVALHRGAPDVFELESSPPVRLRADPGSVASVLLHSDLIRDAYAGAVVDVVVPPEGELVVRVSAHRRRFAPAMLVSAPDGRELGRFDLEALSADELARWVDGDVEWMPLLCKHPRDFFLTRPLEVGDFVEWRKDGGIRRGKLTAIRDISTNETVDRIGGFDPAPYSLRIAVELNGVVTLSHSAPEHWRMGELRLA